MSTRFGYFILAVGLLVATFRGITLNAAGHPDQLLRVATFNLRFASESKPNSWAERRTVLRACVAEMAPDVMGTQEGLYPQLKDVASDLPDYAT